MDLSGSQQVGGAATGATIISATGDVVLKVTNTSQMFLVDSEALKRTFPFFEAMLNRWLNNTRLSVTAPPTIEITLPHGSSFVVLLHLSHDGGEFLERNWVHGVNILPYFIQNAFYLGCLNLRKVSAFLKFMLPHFLTPEASRSPTEDTATDVIIIFISAYLSGGQHLLDQAIERRFDHITIADIRRMEQTEPWAHLVPKHFWPRLLYAHTVQIAPARPHDRPQMYALAAFCLACIHHVRDPRLHSTTCRVLRRDLSYIDDATTMILDLRDSWYMVPRLLILAEGVLIIKSDRRAMEYMP